MNGEAPTGGGPVLTVVIPVFNEEGSIAETVLELHEVLDRAGLSFEIRVVDDCSLDRTREILENLSCPSLRCHRHTRNRGYGAALKTGILHSKSPFLAITDADGTYPNHRIPDLLSLLEGKDMVVGARVGRKVRIPLSRRPAKWLIGKLASYLARFPIPDVNSGLRVFRRKTLMRYLHILPDGFSFTTTITLAMLTCGDEVIYEPIEYAVRVGKSKIRPVRDTLLFVQLIIRTALLFEPLRIFLPFSLVIFLCGIAVGVYSYFFTPKFMDMTTAVLLVGSVQMLGIGMLADIFNRRLSRGGECRDDHPSD